MKLLFRLVGFCLWLFGLHGSDDVEDGEDDAHSGPDVQVRIGACVGKAQERADDVEHSGGDGSTLTFGIPGGQADDAGDDQADCHEQTGGTAHFPVFRHCVANASGTGLEQD